MPAQLVEGGGVRDVLTDLPPGFVGNPQAVPRCPRTSFEGALPQCPPNTQVGVLRAILGGTGEVFGPLYNLAPPPGVAAQLGFSVIGLNALFSASVLSEDGYSVRITTADIPAEVKAATATIWGVPADPGHDPERGEKGGLTSNAPLLPFLTLPTSCDFPPESIFQVDSKLDPGVFSARRTDPLHRQDQQPARSLGLRSGPLLAADRSGAEQRRGRERRRLRLRAEAAKPGSAQPQRRRGHRNRAGDDRSRPAPGDHRQPRGGQRPRRLHPAPIRSRELGLRARPGLPAKLKARHPRGPDAALEEAIEGSVYIAAPHENPFGTLLALYIVAAAPQRGVLIKQAGEVLSGSLTGQLTASFEGLPPVPYSAIEMRLREGPQAPLITPQTCGTYTTTAWLYPFSELEAATVKSAPFKISSGAGGAGCAASEAQLPNSPTLLAGATAPIAGAYSPFVLKLARADGEQRFGSLEVSPPPGLVAKLAGVPYCSEAQIAAAAARSEEGEGAAELAQPSCPAASRVGTVIAGAGAGPTPYYVQGKAYLAGPYKGAPLSLAIITPAIAGPFDLGNVVVRAGVYVNESTAEITVKSDPLPAILHGIALDVRSVSVQMDRSSFTLNPTSCAEKAITAKSISTTGAVANLENRFQVGSCKGLAFSPELALKLSGATTRAKHPALKAVLTQPPGQANLARLSFTLPPTEFIDPNHVSNPCTRPQFKEGKCPPSSVLGKVRAFTPLLDKPLEGPIYFRANGGERELPDAVADLNGQVHLVSVGFVDAVHHKGSEESRIRTTIATVPDAPVSKVVIELKGGKKHGLLVNSANICKSPNKAIVKMAAQNGKTHDSNPRIATSCGK